MAEILHIEYPRQPITPFPN